MKLAKHVKLLPGGGSFTTQGKFHSCCETEVKLAKLVKLLPGGGWEFHNPEKVSQPGGGFTTPQVVKLPGVGVPGFAMGG